jgi:hypothetical protein
MVTPSRLSALALVALLSGCGGDRPAPPSGSAPGPSGGEAPAPLAPDGLRATSVYFSDREARRVVPVTRHLDPDSGLALQAVRAMASGLAPGDPAGTTTAVPEGTRVLGLTIRDSIATVDLTRAFESGAGSASVRMRLAQLVYTLTRFPAVRRVRIHLDGRPAEVFSAEGLDVSRPIGRADFPDLAPWDDDPPVVLTEPVPGSTVRGPVTVRGTANVFEANVGLRVRDGAGKKILETFTTATCGTGCRGTFEKVLELPASLHGDLVIEAYAPSAEDGSDLHNVTSRIHRDP